MGNSTFITIPTIEEIRKWLLSTVQHVIRVEYYLHQLGIESDDPERPHDIVGAGNKFEWEPMRRYALQYRNERKQFKKEIAEALAIHRKQYHHQMWNHPNPLAGKGAMKLGAVDAICSLLEDRQYQGGVHTYRQIETDIFPQSKEAHRIWMEPALCEMQRIPQPHIEVITSLKNIPNLGIPKWTHDTICERVYETIIELEQEHGYDAKILLAA